MHTNGSTHELQRATHAHWRVGLMFLHCGVVAALLAASVGVARAQPPKKVLVLSTNSGTSGKLSVLARKNGIALVHFNLTAGVSAPRNLADYAAVLAYADDGQGLLSNLTAFMPTLSPLQSGTSERHRSVLSYERCTLSRNASHSASFTVSISQLASQFTDSVRPLMNSQSRSR